MPRLRLAFAAYAVLLIALIWQSTPRPIGDGAEYFVQARALSELRSPALTAAQVRDYTAWLNGLGEPFHRLRVSHTYRSETARYEVPHFWVYSAFAAPLLLSTRWLGLHPNHAFTVLNAP